MYQNVRHASSSRLAAALNIYGEVVRPPVLNLRGRKTLYNGRFDDYECHTVWLSKKDRSYRNAVYSDRLLLDGDRYDRLARLHFGEASHYWQNRKPEKIEAFLAGYFMLPEGCVSLTEVTKERNRSNGQHLWVLYYTYDFPAGFCPLP